ncbi:myeloid lymphoid or mixed-lineage leukemia 5 (trithorax, ) [Mortierella alpina]|uniref:Myeloid lymphoid or mixed-lineage leukemia 5 (Trithorax, ) n=1 Tax=Mortierella alpina TaxID=64518 RepID=A0A9P6M265_MORAP|nr:myeloid lymphoid or mixed-lineage leukemia 5 (trithorax, ) [Mortierella alpina]
MSRSAPHQLPTRPRSTVGRRSRQRRDDIENDLSSGLSFLPIQNTNRKRLLTELQSNATLNVDEQASKRHKLIVDDAAAKSPRLTALASSSNTPPLHRTLSDNSSYLNQTPLAREPILVRSQSTVVHRKTDPRSSSVGFESDDADDEEELPNTASTLCSAFTPPVTDSPIPETTKTDDILIVIDSPECPPVDLEQRSSYEDELFGSDTTLTCPEDDSEEEDNDETTAQPTYAPQPSASSASSPSPSPPARAVAVVIPPPPSSPPARAIAVVIPPRRMTTPGPVQRRGPGRPRKVTLPEKTPGEPQERFSDTSTFTFTSPPMSEQPSELVAESSRTSKVSGSLMSRVLDGAKQSSELLDSDLDVSDAETQPECVQLVESLQMLREQILPRPVPGSVVPPSDGNKAILLDEKSTSSLIEIVLAVNELAAATAAENSTIKESPCPGPSTSHEFVVPAQPTECLPRLRAAHADPPVGTSDQTISKPTKPLHRNGPRPFVPRTCREIMTQHPSFSQSSNILAIKSMLKHTLEQGLRKVLNADADSEACSVPMEGPTRGTWETQSWMPVIGNGKGLFGAQGERIAESRETATTAHHTPLSAGTPATQPCMSVISNGKGLFRLSLRKQEEQSRITERRNLVGQMYRVLDISPPPESWDKSSTILTHGLTSGNHHLLRADIRNRLGCDYCKKTYKHKNGLAYHMERCPMARLQTSISNDMDGDSTDSETEEQRNARCPTASSQDMPVGMTNHACSSEEEDDDVEDEEGIIMCVCGSREDEGGMIQCDKCKVWLHLECVDLSEHDLPEDFFCPPCQGLPTPSSGGKSFRHFPNKAKRGVNARKFTRRARKTGSQESEDDDDVAYDERNESTRNDSGLPTDVLGSPQVTLNHVWEQPKGAIFKEKHAPALMLDGSLSQEINLGLDYMTGMDFTGAEELLTSEMDLSFHDSQSFDYLPPTDCLFEPEYTMTECLISEASIDSDGLRTPIDLPDMGFSSMWPGQDLEGFVEETAEGFHLEHHQDDHQATKDAQPSGQAPVLMASSLTNWYYDPVPPRNDDFDPEGLVDLEACL